MQLDKLQVKSVNGIVYVDGAKYQTLQQAATAVCAAGGGTIIVPPGSYAVPSMCSSLRIIGSGKGQGELNQCATTLTYSGSGDAIAIANMNHVYLADFCLKYTGAATTAVAIHNQWGQFVTVERLYIHGAWGVGLQLNPVVAGASTIDNYYREIHTTGFANGGIGCLIDSGASVSQVTNNNYFDNVNCTGGATGSGSRGLKITGTNQINNEIVFKGGQFNATAGTGVEITASSVRNFTMIAPDIEGSNVGIIIGAGNTGTILSANISANTTNVNDSSAGGVSWLGSENLPGVSRNWSVTAPGDQQVNSIRFGAAGNNGNYSINEVAGAQAFASGNAIFEFDTNGLRLLQSALFSENTAPTCSSGLDFTWGDSTAHRLKMCNNGGTATQVVGSGGDINTSDQVTATHLSAPLPKAQGGTAVDNTSVAAHAFFGNNTGSSAAAGFVQPACADLSNAAASCSTDATNAGNLSSGTVPTARMPAFTGDATTSAGAVAVTLAASGVAAGTYTKITVDAKGRATVGATAACGDLSNAAASCSTDTTVASNIASGTLPSGRMPALTGDVTTSVGSLATTIVTGAVSNAKMANEGSNTLKGNPTGSSAAPSDVAVPGCTDTNGQHLNWTSGIGFSCGTTGTNLNIQSNLSPVTGTGSDANIFTYSVPAGVVPVGGSIELLYWFSHSTGTAAVSYKLKIGSTTISNYGSPSGVGTYHGGVILYNQGSSLCTKADYPLITPNPSFQAGPGYGAGNACDFSAGFTVNLTFNVANTDAVTPQFLMDRINK